MGGNLYIGTSTDAYATSTPPALTILNNGNVGVGTSSPPSVFSINDPAGVNPFIIGSSTPKFIVTHGGNVGIGTAAPGAALAIVSNSFFQFTRYNDTAGNGANIQLRRARGTSDSPSAVLTGDLIASLCARDFGETSFTTGGGCLGFYASQNHTDTQRGLYFSISTVMDNVTSQSERMRVTAGGNIGIGTTTPNNLLTIYSTTKAGLEFSGASGSTYKWTIGMDKSDAGRFKIASSTALGTSDRLVIDGAGNLSVGGYATTTAAGVFSPGRYPTGSTPTCTANEEGGFLWNSTTKKTCVCTGSSWIEATSTTPTVCF